VNAAHLKELPFVVIFIKNQFVGNYRNLAVRAAKEKLSRFFLTIFSFFMTQILL
jgi:hypothetical protein